MFSETDESSSIKALGSIEGRLRLYEGASLEEEEKVFSETETLLSQRAAPLRLY